MSLFLQKIQMLTQENEQLSAHLVQQGKQLVAPQGRSYGLDSGQVKIFARAAREKFLGL